MCDAAYEIKWKNIVLPDRTQMAIWRMLIACCIPKAASTHSEYVILISFPLLQLFRGSSPMLRYTHIACLYMPCGCKQAGVKDDHGLPSVMSCLEKCMASINSHECWA
jgi:hypothetical protein